jgi:methionyl aminopeptidase
MSKDYKEAFEKSRIAGSIAAGALDEVAKIIKPGISTDEIDKLCYEFIKR